VAKKPDIWMPIYIGDYLADTAHLSAAEHGSYLILMMHAWGNGGMLPLSEDRIFRMSRMTEKEWSESRDTIMKFWTPCENGYIQKRLAIELEKAKNIQKQHSIAGKASADKRWGKRNGNGACNGDDNGFSNGDDNGVITVHVTDG